jgi:hypothetical protein
MAETIKRSEESVEKEPHNGGVISADVIPGTNMIKIKLDLKKLPKWTPELIFTDEELERMNRDEQ